MKTRSLLRLVPAACALALAFTASPARAATNTVNISGFAFVPDSLTVHAGDTVTWVQKDSVSHTTTSDAVPPVWNSGLLSLGQTFSWTFSGAGTFPYHCIVHATFMKGTIIVLTPANEPPVVQLTSPATGTMFVFPANFTLAADASDPDGTVAKVEFFAGTNSLGTVAAPPFQLQVTNLAPAIYPLTAIATDNQGATNTSDTVTIMIDNPPGVRLTSPGNGAVFLSPAPITLQVKATDSDGTVDHVEFRDGATSLGVVNQSPFALTWTNVPSGTHLVTALATDDMGAATTSALVTLTVGAAAVFSPHNLVSDLPGLADHTDTNLVNPWAIAFSAEGPFWINDNHSGFSTVYNTDGSLVPLVVTVPPPAAGTPPAAPTGMVFNNTTNFLVDASTAAHFIFATEDGTLSAWSAGSTAVLKVDNSTKATVYKGLALASHGGSNLLYATDFHNGRIDVFDATFAPVAFAGAFSDPAIPAGYAPFGIHNLGGQLYVTYAMQDADQHDDVSGPGHGFVDVFDTGGQLVRQFASAGVLNSPWGVTLAPPGFAQFSGDLLVGNFGDGTINALDPATGALLGTLSDANGQPVAIDGLWDIVFGNGVRGGDANRLYFTAGIPGGGSVEDHGLFGSISAVAVVRITEIKDQGDSVTISWTGGTAPYVLQHKDTLTDTSWTDVQTNSNPAAVVVKTGPLGFFRIKD